MVLYRRDRRDRRVLTCPTTRRGLTRGTASQTVSEASSSYATTKPLPLPLTRQLTRTRATCAPRETSSNRAPPARSHRERSCRLRTMPSSTNMTSQHIAPGAPQRTFSRMTRQCARSLARSIPPPKTPTTSRTGREYDTHIHS